MILEIIMHCDISDTDYDKHHTPVFCHTDSLEIDLQMKKYEEDASENDYYYVTEIDFNYD